MSGMGGEMEESYKKQIVGLQDELDRTKCRSLLVESGVEVTEVRLKALKSLQESERHDLVKTWKSGNVSSAKRPLRTGSVMQESAPVNYPKSQEEFKRLLG
jgi:ribosomal protein L12E/L44/L45/RPP1/RPP2